MAETVLNQQESKLETNGDARRQNYRLKRVVGILLSVVMIGLTAYVINLQHQNNNILAQSADLALTASGHANDNYITYVGKYKETKSELDETTRKLNAVNLQLNQVTAELDTTKGMLAQTQGMLVSAQDDNTKLKQELQGLDNLRSTENVQNVNDLQTKISTLKDKDTQISAQLQDLKSQLRAFDVQIANIQEGQSLIALFQNKIRLVKSHMRLIKQEAYYAKVAAQKEKDRLATLNGNSGFVVRDGHLLKPEGQKKEFAIDVKIMQ